MCVCIRYETTVIKNDENTNIANQTIMVFYAKVSYVFCVCVCECIAVVLNDDPLLTTLCTAFAHKMSSKRLPIYGLQQNKPHMVILTVQVNT